MKIVNTSVRKVDGIGVVTGNPAYTEDRSEERRVGKECSEPCSSG